MNLSRRGFLGAILAAGAAPAIVKAESLMKIVVPKHVADGQFLVMTGYRFGNGDREQMEGRIQRGHKYEHLWVEDDGRPSGWISTDTEIEFTWRDGQIVEASMVNPDDMRQIKNQMYDAYSSGETFNDVAARARSGGKSWVAYEIDKSSVLVGRKETQPLFIAARRGPQQAKRVPVRPKSTMEQFMDAINMKIRS